MYHHHMYTLVSGLCCVSSFISCSLSTTPLLSMYTHIYAAIDACTNSFPPTASARPLGLLSCHICAVFLSCLAPSTSRCTSYRPHPLPRLLQYVLTPNRQSLEVRENATDKSALVDRKVIDLKFEYRAHLLFRGQLGVHMEVAPNIISPQFEPLPIEWHHPQSVQVSQCCINSLFHCADGCLDLQVYFLQLRLRKIPNHFRHVFTTNPGPLISFQQFHNLSLFFAQPIPWVPVEKGNYLIILSHDLFFQSLLQIDQNPLPWLLHPLYLCIKQIHRITCETYIGARRTRMLLMTSTSCIRAHKSWAVTQGLGAEIGRGMTLNALCFLVYSSLHMPKSRIKPDVKKGRGSQENGGGRLFLQSAINDRGAFISVSDASWCLLEVQLILLRGYEDWDFKNNPPSEHCTPPEIPFANIFRILITLILFMSLFDKIRIGNLLFKNRIVMSAMTRLRADKKTGCAGQLHKQYYSQRAGAGLILTEASCIHERGNSWPGSANIMNKEQADSWKPVIKAVKSKRSNIYLQAYHGGRNCHKVLNGGLETWGASPIAIRGKVPGTDLPYDKPKEMTESEIRQVVGQFQNAAKLAKSAGFDGFHIHAAAGYIIDGFIRSCSNQRKDKYGGSPENRARFLLEIVDAAKTVFPSERISVKLSPLMRYGDMNDDNPKQTFSTILQLLDKKKIGAVEIASGSDEAPLFDYPDPKSQFPNVLKQLRPFFSGIIIGNQGFNPQTAKKAIADDDCDMVSFGRLYINNPDLAQRIEKGWPLSTDLYQPGIYGQGPRGYTDYSFYKSP